MLTIKVMFPSISSLAHLYLSPSLSLSLPLSPLGNQI